MKKKPTPIEYTLEQFMADQKFKNDMITGFEKQLNVLDKMARTMEKFQKLEILHNHRINMLEKKIKKLERRK